MAFYEYPTNYSNGSSVDGVADFFFNYPNFVLDYWYSGGWLLFIWLFAFLVLLPFTARRALLVSSLACFVFSTYLAMLGNVNLIFPISFIVLTIIGGIGAMADSNSY